MSLTRITMAMLFMFFLIITSGCAVMNRENRPLLEGLDAVVKNNGLASSTTARIMLAPLAVMVGTAAVAIDMALITPVRATHPAFDDTTAWIWKNPQGSDMRQAILFLPKVAITPVVITTDWACRSLFTTKF
jgi:hypothetical protein